MNSYIKVPESQNSDNHGRRGPAFSVRAVENEGWVRVLGQAALHGLQQLIKLLRADAHRAHVEKTHRLKLYHNVSLLDLEL